MYWVSSNQKKSCLKPKVDSPSFAATVAVAAPLQHYQVDSVHQPLGLRLTNYLVYTYCRMLNFCENFIMRVSRGSLDSPKYNSPNIMLAYENRAPDVTVAKFKNRERQTYPNRQLKCSRTLSILQYIIS